VNPASVELHIEELVLHGLGSWDQYRIADAVERQLARLLGTGNLPLALAQSAEMARVDGGAFDVAPGSTAETIGGQVASSVFGGLKE